MQSTNGNSSRKAILYARVSTEEQAKSGYSLAQQIEALREYAAREGYEVLEEVTDPGQSGASLERPGMDRVRDLIVTADVSVVLAQDRDRFACEPAYHYLLRKEFEEHGCKLQALNDRGAESPEGELTDGILDQLAKFERAKTAERTRRGRLRKAREGKIVAVGPRATYGFKYNAARDAYLVDDKDMEVVLCVFRMVGDEGLALRAVRRTFECEGVPTPNGQPWWNTRTLKDIVLDDCYRPHAFEEIRELVTADVAAGLDPDKLYGVWWYNRRRTTTRQVAEHRPEGRRYRRIQQTVKKPRSEWVAVPVPHAGIPLKWVNAARERVKHNHQPSSSADRFWELSGGVLYCGGCGKRMGPDRARRSPDQPYYFYYRCNTKHKRGKDACPMPKSFRADRLEPLVWEFVSGLLRSPDPLRKGIERMIEEEKSALRDDPEKEVKTLLSKLTKLNRKRSGFQDMAAEGLITFDELREQLTVLEEAREAVKGELEAAGKRRERVEQFEGDKEALLKHYSLMAHEALDTATSEDRRRVYEMLRLRVVPHPDGTIEAKGEYVGGSNVRTAGTTSRYCYLGSTHGGSPTSSGTSSEKSSKKRLPGTDDALGPGSLLFG
jgi:site-specific DNA recombinase